MWQLVGVFYFFLSFLIFQSLRISSKQWLCRIQLSVLKSWVNRLIYSYERISGMQSAQNYLRNSIQIHNVPSQGKRDFKKVSEMGIWVPHALNEKNKEDKISIANSNKSSFKAEKLPVSWEYYHRWWKMHLLWQCLTQEAVDWQG